MSDLFALARQNKADDLRAMFNKGIGVKAADEAGRTLLHHAAQANAPAVMDLLLERGASLDSTDRDGLNVRSFTNSSKTRSGGEKGSGGLLTGQLSQRAPLYGLV
jgi:ankyrin repeat protein